MGWPTGAVLVLGGDGEYGLCPLGSQVLLPTKLTVIPLELVLPPHALSSAIATSSRTGRRGIGLTLSGDIPPTAAAVWPCTVRRCGSSASLAALPPASRRWRACWRRAELWSSTPTSSPAR